MGGHDSERVRVMVLHRQRLVAEATAAALNVLAPELVLNVTTSPVDAQEALGRVHVLVCDGALLPDNISRRAEADHGARVVALGSADTVDPVTQSVSALRAGASGWLPADSSPELVLHVLRVVLDGDRWIPASLLGAIVHRLIAPPTTGGTELTLSPREKTVLDLVAVGHTSKEIAEQLGLSPNTVRTHRQRLFRKIEAHSAIEAASWLRGARDERPSEHTPSLRWDAP
jgi:DNA-binding NarL/FixJ family response regulator